MQPHFHGLAGAHHADGVPIADANHLPHELFGTGEGWRQQDPQHRGYDSTTNTTPAPTRNPSHSFLSPQKGFGAAYKPSCHPPLPFSRANPTPPPRATRSPVWAHS